MSRTLREIRADAERFNVTLRELVEATGLAEATVHAALSGSRDVKNSTVEALSAGLDVVMEKREEAASKALAGETAKP